MLECNRAIARMHKCSNEQTNVQMYKCTNDAMACMSHAPSNPNPDANWPSSLSTIPPSASKSATIKLWWILVSAGTLLGEPVRTVVTKDCLGVQFKQWPETIGNNTEKWDFLCGVEFVSAVCRQNQSRYVAPNARCTNAQIHKCTNAVCVCVGSLPAIPIQIRYT